MSEHIELPFHQEADRIKDNMGNHICYMQRPVGHTARDGMLISCERAEYIVLACNAFEDIFEGISLIVEKKHYSQLEAQAKSQPDLLTACEYAKKYIESLALVECSADQMENIGVLDSYVTAAIEKACPDG